MTRRWIITLLLICLAAIGALAWQRHARTVPWEECSELYRHYAHADGIQAAYLHNYKVNDTLTIDATLLEATDSAGWQLLQHDFSIPQPKNPAEIASLEEGGDVIGIIQNWKIIPDIDQFDIVTSSYRDRQVYIFHIQDSNENKTISKAIFLHKIKQLNP